MVIEIAQVVQDFAIILILASVMALISYKLKQPLVIGYIIAGIIIGPHTPPFSLIWHMDVLNLFAEIGIILLLFVVGMEFPIDTPFCPANKFYDDFCQHGRILRMIEHFGIIGYLHEE